MNPPFAIEQAVDLILALPAHRSSNANHVDFGKMLVDEYFVKLRDYYKSDPVAYAYLNELFAAIASAVRAFSVQRDIFQTQRTAKTNGRDAVIEKSKRIWSYSLLEDFRGQITTLFTGLTLTGLAAYLNAGYKSLLALPSVWLALIIWDIVPQEICEFAYPRGGTLVTR